MNHTRTTLSLHSQANLSTHLTSLPYNTEPNLPFILGETNSLYNQGRPGLSNTFGAALWGIDFNLYALSLNISRVHMHQGTNYRYQAWQPIDTNLTSRGTKAPYYGSIAVAAFLGNYGGEEAQAQAPKVVNLPLPGEEEAAYAVYTSSSAESLSRVMVINMQAYNTSAYNSDYLTPFPRPVERYTFQLPSQGHRSHYAGRRFQVQRLLANGSDAITGVTFDGWSYNYDLDEGRPVRLGNVTTGEVGRVGREGRVSVDVEWSSAVILDFGREEGNGEGGEDEVGWWV